GARTPTSPPGTSPTRYPPALRPCPPNRSTHPHPGHDATTRDTATSPAPDTTQTTDRTGTRHSADPPPRSDRPNTPGHPDPRGDPTTSCTDPSPTTHPNRHQSPGNTRS